MGQLQIVERKEAYGEIGGAIPLPERYMEDYTVMGLAVDSVPTATRVLEKAAVPYLHGPCGPKVWIGDGADIRKVVGVLVAGGLDCEITDLVDSVYQG